MSKRFYFKLFSLVNKVKWFQELLSITNNSIKHQSFIQTQLNIKNVLFQTIQFCISTQFECKNSSIQANHFTISAQFSSIWPIDRILPGATTPGQSRPGRDSNEGALRIP